MGEEEEEAEGDGWSEVGGCLNHAGCKTPPGPRELRGNGIFYAITTAILIKRVLFYFGTAKAEGLKTEVLCRSRMNIMFLGL